MQNNGNYDRKYLNKLINNTHFDDIVLPIVTIAHGMLFKERFIRVPENYIIITFVDDGWTLDVDSGMPKKCTMRKCNNPLVQFIYFWIQYLQSISNENPELRGREYISLIKQNIGRLNETMKQYRNEIGLFSNKSIRKSVIYYPDDLICETNINLQNSELMKLGTTEWKRILKNPDMLFKQNTKENEFSLGDEHLFSGLEKRVVKKKNMLLSNMLNYMVEKTGLTNRTRKSAKQKAIVKVLFVATCRGYSRMIQDELSFSLKPWISNPFKQYARYLNTIRTNPYLSSVIKLDSLVKSTNDLKEFMKTKRTSIELASFSSFLYKYFCVGSNLFSLHHEFISITLEDVDNIQKLYVNNKLNKSNYLGVYIPLRNMLGNMVEMNSILNSRLPNAVFQNSFYIPKNISGYTIHLFLYDNGLFKLIDTPKYDMMWNENARKYIFEKWESNIEPYLSGTRTQKYEYITNMRKLFVYKKRFRGIKEYTELYSLFYKNNRIPLNIPVPDVYKYTYEKLVEVMSNELIYEPLTPYHSQIKYYKFKRIDKKFWPLWSAVYKYSLLFSEFPYETPFEFAFANYRWVDENGNSVINDIVSGEPSYVERVMSEYKKGNIAISQNFFGHIGLYREVMQKILKPILDVFIHVYPQQNEILLKNMMLLFSHNDLLMYIQPNKFLEPYKKNIRYIETFHGLDVVYGQYNLDNISNLSSYIIT